MIGAQGVFQRYEKKYLLNAEQYRALRDGFQPYLEADQYGKSTICNSYFDTPTHQLIRNSLEKPVYKEKLRLRSYGTPQPDTEVFVELKKKYKKVVYKRRIQMPLRQAQAYLYCNERTENPAQIQKEIDWFLDYYPGIAPAMYLSYDRIALRGIEDPSVRVTFDSTIQWRETDLLLTEGSWGKQILEPGQRLMEIKIAGAMPLWMSWMLSENGVFPTSFSKYGKAYLQSAESKKGLIICA
ncbi:MAG: polyphosphate polymerase domain-containing protein [Oscillospiraceae bacterium]|nr:polyphosphate polymerase domain-containing protein [Oscillospiraceae bacterium]